MRLDLMLLAAALAASLAANARAAPTPAPTVSARPAAPVVLSYSPDRQALPPGIVRTSVDRRFSRERVTGSAGFLCGRPDFPVQSGSAGAYGSDPSGRFLGASLRLTFH
jgi:hypothetical protein